ncbi:MAG TPA: DNA-binding transcriptional regulator [Tepidisphaeraceae bacterium]|nr:DNA-binding transcriptional regulator [Tepidisphaeraceae bacterium]
MSGRAKKLRVALAVPQGLPFLERLLHGITDYARQEGGWAFTRLPEALGTSVEWLRHWSGDGAFVLIVTESDARAARRLRFPAVNLASHLPGTGLLTVVVDHGKIGELAARHLLDRRFRRFGYYGAAGLWYSQLRRDGFRQTVLTAGGSCQVCEATSGARARGRWRDQQRQLETWLRSLHPPVGIMASTDLRAGMVLEACRSLGLKVPEQVAVIGVDNDPVFAEFNDPPLTSVSRNDHEVGVQAAAMLARLMRKGMTTRRTRVPRLVLVPPDGIVQRGSTATVAIDDPVIHNAVHYIRDHIHENFGMKDLMNHVPLSRRAFEYRFRAALGRSPHHYINSVRIDVARHLLADRRGLKLSAIASTCGFSSLQRFRLVFLRIAGKTPSDYRRYDRGSISTDASAL